MFQSTRPQGARQIYGTKKGKWFVVSIHAPAGGATEFQVLFDCAGVVSIHAPAGGATR